MKDIAQRICEGEVYALMPRWKHVRDIEIKFEKKLLVANAEMLV